MPTGSIKIDRLRLSGFKSIREADLSLGSLNVVIGANGAGKSNLAAYFSMLRASPLGNRDAYIGRFGGPGAFLHLGPKTTSVIKASLTVTSEVGRGNLHEQLVFRPPDSLVNIPFCDRGASSSSDLDLADLLTSVERWSVGTKSVPSFSVRVFKYLMEEIGVYHFHDTTLTAPIRLAGYVEDNRALQPDAGNLAAVLFRLRETRPKVYQRILGSIRLVAPFFDDFSLAPRSLDKTRILLNWKQVGCDDEFGPHQLSDGTLRAMALITLLLQPEEELPRLIVIDEPEIGLHPYALSVVVSLLGKASHHSQIIVATQSVQMLDECEPEDVICVERRGPVSTFKRLDRESLSEWLAEYSLGEVWQKNIIGGSPH